jgi:DNA protecting protein DprA
MTQSRTVSWPDVLRRGTLPGPLFWLGADLPEQRLRVAVVGSRVATPQQLDHAFAFGRDLAELGVIVVSGGALGVDTLALQGALAAQSPAWVPPVAVVPASVDAPFPKQNHELFGHIVARGGALCSKFAADTVHCRGRFLARNDLLVQLVDAVIVVCADRPSGTLHCATSAWRREVPVFAVPWAPDAPHTAGSQALLFAGARALWPGEPLCAAMDTLQREPRALLTRAAELPLWPAADAAAPTKARQTFDAVATAWPCYAPDAPAHGLSHGDPPGCDAGLVARLRAELAQAGGQGLTVDELAATTQTDRTAVAATLLNWTLHGGLKRVAGSWYALDPAPRL